MVKRYLLILILLFFVSPVMALSNVSEYKVISIDEITNIKYLDSYNYSIFVNGSYLGVFEKGEMIEIPDNSEITIYIPSNLKTSLNSNSFMAFIGVGFYSFMQYGIYIITIILVFAWITTRKRR